MYSLPKDYKKAWIDALRSGEYRQEYNHLQCEGGFCALGVAYYAVSNIPQDTLEYKTSLSREFLENDCQGAYHVPEQLLNATTLSDCIVRMNDEADERGLHHDFNFIANWIEDVVEDE